MLDAGVEPTDLSGRADTSGPGLIGALMVGAWIARSLAFAWGSLAVEGHHMEGHLLAPMLEDTQPEFPFVALLVSGGHTQLVEVQAIGQYKILGESIDDAAGEAFDKTAKLLGLDYPGGPMLAKLAEQGEPGVYKFPRPMTDRPGLDFSFSGLKTAAANAIRGAGIQLSGSKSIQVDEPENVEQVKADIAHAFQQAVVDTIAIKCRRAVEQTGIKTLVIAGGVSANTELRKKLKVLMLKNGGDVFYPRHDLCTDNGAMIAYAGAQRLAKYGSNDLKIKAKPRWSIEELPEI